MEVSEIIKKDIDAKVASIDAQIQQNTRDIAEHQAIIALLTGRNEELEKLKAAYTSEVVSNITVKAAPVAEPVVVVTPQ